MREEARFSLLREHLRAFEDVPIGTDDYERAAQMSTICRASGLASSSVDMLICAIAERTAAAVFTTDPDFLMYSRVLQVPLFNA